MIADRGRVYQLFKYAVYAFLTINIFVFFAEEWAAASHRFSDGIMLADIIEAFVLINYLEENAQRQYMASQMGTPYVFTPDEIAACREKLWNKGLFQRTWDHFTAKLEEVG